ncbi:MAG: helix-turn-helix domain-containing protein [Chloroflexota bacterium]|nr:helix-turn-helix domain-containing protein [Chloroflexota bacterium]
MSQPPERRKLVLRIDDDFTDIELLLKGLASAPRLEILRYLGSHTVSVGEIAEALDMPASTAALHITQLEKAGLIKTDFQPASRGVKKVCVRVYDEVVIALPSSERTREEYSDISMPIGSYVDAEVVPMCGLASATGIIGVMDDPETFFDPARIEAQLLWFRQGYVEYRFPNRLPTGAILESIQVSMEICSEAPLHNHDWRSDVTMWMNGIEIGTWTSPGDFGGERGFITPTWWEEWNSQYGLLKVWKVTDDGTYVDGVRVSSVSLDDLALEKERYIRLRLGVKADAPNVGGLNIFGRGFGNYPQDILMRLRYRSKEGGISHEGKLKEAPLQVK